MLAASIAVEELPELAEIAREVKSRRLARLRAFRRFDEYERAVAELAVFRAQSRPDGRTEAPEPRSFATS